LAYIRERWGRMLDWGATSWWETWNPGASFCHGWSGGPTYNLSADIVGIRPLKPGFAEVGVTPHWVGLRRAVAVVPTARGEVRASWLRNEERRTVNVRVETAAGVPCELTLPTEGQVTMDRAPGQDGVVRLPAAPGTMRFRIERGGAAQFDLQEAAAGATAPAAR
jgi:hypothetical protein